MKNLISKYFPDTEVRKRIKGTSICYYINVKDVPDAIDRQAAMMNDIEYLPATVNQQFAITFLMVT